MACTSLKGRRPVLARSSQCVGDPLPAVRHVLAAQVQAPQQGRAVDQGGGVRIAAVHQPAVEDAQHGAEIALVEAEQRFVPGQVDGEGGAVGPDAARVVEPGGAVGAAPLHFERMRHGVHRTALAGLDAQRLAPDRFGRHRVGRPGQAEGVHRQHVAVAGLVGVPVPQCRDDARAQPLGAAELEIAEMGHAQGPACLSGRLRRSRRTGAAIAPCPCRARPGGGEMGAFALAGPRQVRTGRLQGGGERRQRIPRGGHHQARRAQAVRGGEIGPRPQHRFDDGLRISLPGMQQLERLPAGRVGGGIVELGGGLRSALHGATLRAAGIGRASAARCREAVA